MSLSQESDHISSAALRSLSPCDSSLHTFDKHVPVPNVYHVAIWKTIKCTVNGYWSLSDYVSVTFPCPHLPSLQHPSQPQQTHPNPSRHSFALLVNHGWCITQGSLYMDFLPSDAKITPINPEVSLPWESHSLERVLGLSFQGKVQGLFSKHCRLLVSYPLLGEESGF